MRYLEKTDSGLLLQTLNQQVDVQIGDPLGSGVRQEGGEVDEEDGETRDAEVDKLEETIRAVREGSTVLPSISLYKIMSEEPVASCVETDPAAKLLAVGCHDSEVKLYNLLPAPDGYVKHEVKNNQACLQGSIKRTSVRAPLGGSCPSL